MRDELLGSTDPVLSISLEPGESVLAASGRFAWMTDSIRLTASDASPAEGPPEGPPEGREGLALSVYTATGTVGVVAFTAWCPGRVLNVEADHGYLIRGSGFIAGTRGVRVVPAGSNGLPLWRLTGSGRAWVGLAGDVIEREITAGQSLRAQTEHVGMFVPTITVQVTEVRGICVLSGTGTVWLQSRSGNHQQSRSSVC
jgi:uncharacterized protein (AIM24 family)